MFFSSRKGSEGLPDAVEVVEHHLVNWSGTHEVEAAYLASLLALQRLWQWQSLGLMLVAEIEGQKAVPRAGTCRTTQLSMAATVTAQYLVPCSTVMGSGRLWCSRLWCCIA